MTGRRTGGYDDNVHDSGTHLHAMAMLDIRRRCWSCPPARATLAFLPRKFPNFI